MAPTLTSIVFTVTLIMSCTCYPQSDEVIAAERTLAAPLNMFTGTLFQKVSTGNQNTVISPFSLSTALSMLMLGAGDQTADLIANKLNLDSVNLTDGQRIHELFHEVRISFL